MTWWSRVLYEGYCHGDTAPLHRLMAQVMWRRTKKDVIDQIQLPPQTETVRITILLLYRVITTVGTILASQQ